LEHSKLIYQYFAGISEKNHEENFNPNSRFGSRDSNSGHPEYEEGILTKGFGENIVSYKKNFYGELWFVLNSGLVE
jgi:hypothetical protein